MEVVSRFFESNAFTGLSTIITAVVAISLYYWEQKKKKRDAAKIIIQEVRRAEDLINEYKEQRKYRFTQKIIATNSWAKSIHYFVDNLAQDEIDKISTLYSTGEYLDTLIAKISVQMFDDKVANHKKEVQQIVTGLQQNLRLNPQSTSVGAQSGEQIVGQSPNQQRVIPINIQIPAPWQILLDEISLNYEPIYHTNICAKLKKIAKIK